MRVTRVTALAVLRLATCSRAGTGSARREQDKRDAWLSMPAATRRAMVAHGLVNVWRDAGMLHVKVTRDGFIVAATARAVLGRAV